MSADNGIIVKKIDNLYYVVDNACFSMSFTDKYIKENSKQTFPDRLEALGFAHNLERNGYYEYGVQELKDEDLKNKLVLEQLVIDMMAALKRGDCWCEIGIDNAKCMGWHSGICLKIKKYLGQE